MPDPTRYVYTVIQEPSLKELLKLLKSMPLDAKVTVHSCNCTEVRYDAHNNAVSIVGR